LSFGQEIEFVSLTVCVILWIVVYCKYGLMCTQEKL